MNNNQQRIQELAHQIWESEGKPHGQSVRHWETACKLVAAENENHGAAVMQELNKSTICGSNHSSTTSDKKTHKSKVATEDETLLTIVPKTQKKSSSRKNKAVTN